MSIIQQGLGGLEYFPCHYGQSAQLFRGPARALEGEYMVFLGADETYGRFVARPYPCMVEEDSGLPAVNLAIPNAGPDAWLADPDLLDVINGARAVVLRLPGARNMSNRYYAVHPRRNDRFLQATGLMRGLFPEVDFTAFHYTGHLLSSLRELDGARFATLRAELQAAWLLRMQLLLGRIAPPVMLFWFARHAPGVPGEEGAQADELSGDPTFVTQEMVARLSETAEGLACAVPSADLLALGSRGMFFTEAQAEAAARMLPVAAHELAAEMLVGPLTAMLSEKRPRHLR